MLAVWHFQEDFLLQVKKKDGLNTKSLYIRGLLTPSSVHPFLINY